jgi:uncharacterized membrane protein YcaP (DUF421 family)
VDLLLPENWNEILVPDTPLLEILMRGTVMYLGLLLLLRFVLKRQAGAISLTDLLVVVLLADAAQNALADDYRSLSDGLLLVAVIVFWAYALDWLGYRFTAINRLVHPQPLPLIRRGRLIPGNLRRELITEDELMSQLREQGIDDVAKVKRAHMEGDGRISVIPLEEEDRPHTGRKDDLPTG